MLRALRGEVYIKELICQCGSELSFIDTICIANKNGYMDVKALYRCDKCNRIELEDCEYRGEMYTEEYLDDQIKLAKKYRRNDIITFSVGMLSVIIITLLVFLDIL